MKQQFAISHQYTILQETRKIWQILNKPVLKHVKFLQKYKEKWFYVGHNFLQECVFVTHLSGNVRISVLWIVWVRTNCCFMSGVLFCCINLLFTQHLLCRGAIVSWMVVSHQSLPHVSILHETGSLSFFHTQSPVFGLLYLCTILVGTLDIFCTWSWDTLVVPCSSCITVHHW